MKNNNYIGTHGVCTGGIVLKPCNMIVTRKCTYRDFFSVNAVLNENAVIGFVKEKDALLNYILDNINEDIIDLRQFMLSME